MKKLALQDILNDKDCEELDPDSGSIQTGNPKNHDYNSKRPPRNLNLNTVPGKV